MIFNNDKMNIFFENSTDSFPCVELQSSLILKVVNRNDNKIDDLIKNSYSNINPTIQKELDSDKNSKMITIALFNNEIPVATVSIKQKDKSEFLSFLKKGNALEFDINTIYSIINDSKPLYELTRLASNSSSFIKYLPQFISYLIFITNTYYQSSYHLFSRTNFFHGKFYKKLFNKDEITTLTPFILDNVEYHIFIYNNIAHSQIIRGFYTQLINQIQKKAS